MRVLLINPPLSFPEYPYSAIPILLGQLINRGIDAHSFDFNVEFLKRILSSEFLYNTKKKIQYMLDNENLSDEHKRRIEKFLYKYKDITNKVINEADNYYKLLINNNRTKEDSDYIRFALKLAYIPYYPSLIGFKSDVIQERNKKYLYTYKDLLNRTTNLKDNIYIEIYKSIIQNLNLSKYDLFAITIPFENNLYPALTLSRTLKEQTNSKVILGGIYVTSTINSYVKYPDLFGCYFDEILTGEGELSLYQYIQYMKKEIPIEKVDGIVYKRNNTIFKNATAFVDNIDDIKFPAFNDIDFNDYANKKISLEFSKGCYWGKCSYCYSHKIKKYYTQSPDKAVDIIQYIINETGIDDFSINDDSLSINFAKKFAEEILKRNLKIKFTCFLRFEKTLTYETLKILHNAGLVSIFFGMESASERMLKLMNKGIDINIAERILKDCHKIGIRTSLGFMFGFPTETEDDIMKTINFQKRNKKYITKSNNFYFTILKSSNILCEKDKFQITNIRDIEEFSNYLLYDAPSFPKEKLREILKQNEMEWLEIYVKW